MKENRPFRRKKNQIHDCSRSNQCLKQFKVRILPLTRVPVSGLPSNISTWSGRIVGIENSGLQHLFLLDCIEVGYQTIRLPAARTFLSKRFCIITIFSFLLDPNFRNEAIRKLMKLQRQLN